MGEIRRRACDRLSCSARWRPRYVFRCSASRRWCRPTRRCSRTSALAFLPGAKRSGCSGTSSARASGWLLRIMAGDDQEFRGEAALGQGASVGMLAQERRSTRTNVRGNVEKSVADKKALLDQLRRAGDRLLRPDRRRVRHHAGKDRTRRTHGTWRPARIRGNGRITCPCRRRRRRARSGWRASAIPSRRLRSCWRRLPGRARHDQPAD